MIQNPGIKINVIAMSLNGLGRRLSGSVASFDQVMKAQRGHTNGFDYLRIGLALSVLFIHIVYIAAFSIYHWLWNSWFAPFELSVLPAFFVLSGFLVTGSLMRNNIPQYLTLRAIRIFPALAVVTTLSAIVLGGLVTTLPIRNYLTSGGFHAYFFNIIGYIHFTLPGVFGGQWLNIPLWTIPFELGCYITPVGLVLMGLMNRKWLFAALLIAGVIVMTVTAVHSAKYHIGWNVPGRMLILCFLFGVASYLFKSVLPHNAVLFALSALLTYIFLTQPNLVFLAAAPLAYATIYIGLLRLRPVPFGDLSYGVYLFHFPIARSLFELTGRSMAWEMLLVLTVSLSGAVAAISWRFIERPALENKRHVLAVVDATLLWTSRHVPWAVQVQRD